MIELSLDTIFLIYLGITLSTILGVWTHSHYKKKKEILYSPEESSYRCEFCHFVYLTEETQDLNRCPQCGLYNKK